MHRKALLGAAEWWADQGMPQEAARRIARLLQLDPADRLGGMEMLRRKGVVPAQATEEAAGLRM